MKNAKLFTSFDQKGGWKNRAHLRRATRAETRLIKHLEDMEGGGTKAGTRKCRKVAPLSFIYFKCQIHTH